MPIMFDSCFKFFWRSVAVWAHNFAVRSMVEVYGGNFEKGHVPRTLFRFF